MIVLDTHVLLWWALDPEQLSPRAAELLAQMERHGGFASSISLWELAVKVRQGKLQIRLGVDELAKRLRRGGVVDVLPVDTETWLRSAALDWTHRDPADRVIVATALLRGVPVLTRDQMMHAFAGVECVW